MGTSFDLHSGSAIPREERVKFFTLSSANGGEDILNSVVVDSNSNSSKPNSLVNRKRKLTQQEKELLNFEKACLICQEKTVDAIYSPCFHGGVCFTCAKDNLVRKNSCYYCREVCYLLIQNVFKVYQVKPSTANSTYYRVVKAFFVYDKREESLYDQYVQEIEQEEAEAQRVLSVIEPVREIAESNPPVLVVPAPIRINETVNTDDNHGSEGAINHGLTLEIPLQRNPSKTNSVNNQSDDAAEFMEGGRDRLKSDNVTSHDNRLPPVDRRVRLESFDAMFTGGVTSNEVSPHLGPQGKSIDPARSPHLGSFSAKSKSASIESLHDNWENSDQGKEPAAADHKEPMSPSFANTLQVQKGVEDSPQPRSPGPPKLLLPRSPIQNRQIVPANIVASRIALNQIEEVEEHLDHD